MLHTVKGSKAGGERVDSRQGIAEVALDLHVLPKPDDLGLDLAAEAPDDHEREEQRARPHGHTPDRRHDDETEEAPPLVASLSAPEVAECERAFEGSDHGRVGGEAARSLRLGAAASGTGIRPGSTGRTRKRCRESSIFFGRPPL